MDDNFVRSRVVKLMQEFEALRCPGQFRKLFEQQQNGVKERVVIIFNGPLNPAMRSPSPGIWRTRIAIKEEVLRQKVHLDVKYCSFNYENVSAALTTVFFKQNMLICQGKGVAYAC